MSMVLLIVYLVIFILQIVLLVVSLRRKTVKLWISLFLSEVVPMLGAYLLMRYFDTLPGYGIMPGLVYFGETLFSMGVVVLYAANLFVSLCAFVILRIIQKAKAHGSNP